MMTTLKRIASAIAAISSYGSFAYDSSDGKPKFVDENGLLMALNADGLRDQNLIINGNFDFAQRQLPGTATTYTETAGRRYNADRWTTTNENASIQYRRVDTTAAPQTGMVSKYYGEYTKITSAGKMVTAQWVESGNCLHLRGKKVRMQMRLRASVAKTMRIALLQLNNAGGVDQPAGWLNGAPSGTFISAFGANGTDPTFGASIAKINPDTADNATINATGLTCSVTTTFQRFGGSFTLPSDFRNLAVVIITDSQFSAADRIEITEVGLYDGVEIRDWAERAQTTQLVNCQRYYSKSFSVDVAPAQNIGINTGEAKTKKIVAGATTGRFEDVRFPVNMRVQPTIVLFNPLALDAQVRDESGALACTAAAVVGTSERQFSATFTANAATVAEALCGVHWSADAEI